MEPASTGFKDFSQLEHKKIGHPMAWQGQVWNTWSNCVLWLADSHIYALSPDLVDEIEQEPCEGGENNNWYDDALANTVKFVTEKAITPTATSMESTADLETLGIDQIKLKRATEFKLSVFFFL